MLHPEQPLYIYELKGGLTPLLLDLEGLLGVWPEADYTYLFFTRPADSTLARFVRQHPEFRLSSQYHLRYGEWQQLAEREPFVVDRFKVITRYQSLKLSADEILLWIDPGVIFGSGLHPTTRGCLKALSLLFSLQRPARVLDLGTGTGILAIAAARLGAQRVEAVDLNPMAVSAATANCRRNGVEDRVQVRLADAGQYLPEADLLCVNIHFDFLQTFLEGPELYRYRWAIIGGFLKEKLSDIFALLSSCVRVKEPIVEEKGWITLVVEIEGKE